MLIYKRQNDIPCNYRDLAGKYGIKIASISRTMKHEPTEYALIEASDGFRRQKRVTEEEEKLIRDAALEFHINGHHYIVSAFDIWLQY